MQIIKNRLFMDGVEYLLIKTDNADSFKAKSPEKFLPQNWLSTSEDDLNDRTYSTILIGKDRYAFKPAVMCSAEELGNRLMDFSTVEEIFKKASNEIKGLRHHNMIMSARLTMFDQMMQLFNANSGRGGGDSAINGSDPLFQMENILKAMGSTDSAGNR